MDTKLQRNEDAVDRLGRNRVNGAIDANASTQQTEVDREGERRIRLELEQAAGRNAELLHQIDETEAAVALLHGQQARLETLRDELNSQRGVVRSTNDDAEAQYKIHKSYQESITKRWYYIITKMRERFRRKAQAEQEAYLQIVQKKVAAEKRQHELENAVEKVEQEGKQIEPQARRHGEAHQLIDELYETIFAGPTPGFPDEDELEVTRARRLEGHERATERLKAITRSQRQLGLIKRVLTQATFQLTQAQSEIEYSVFSPDGAYIWLRRCDKYLEQALSYSDGFRKLLPEPAPIQVIESDRMFQQALHQARSVAQGAFAMEAYYVGRSTLYEAVEHSSRQVQVAVDQQVNLTKIFATVEEDGRSAVRNSARRLEDARQALQEVRQRAFEIVAGFGAAAPPYTECCDRARQYAGDAIAACQRLPMPTVEEVNNLPAPPTYEHITTDTPA